MYEYYKDSAFQIYDRFDHEFIDKLLIQTYELRRDPKEREREKTEKAAEKLLKEVGILQIDGREFDLSKGLFDLELPNKEQLLRNEKNNG